MNEMKVIGSFTARGAAALPAGGAFAPARGSGAGLTTSFVATAIALATCFFARAASRTATWLRGPRTGLRATKIQPTPGTFVAPRSRPVREQPRVLAMELLERVVREHDTVHLLGDAQQEGVTPADGARRRRDELAAPGELLEARAFGFLDPMCERRVDDDRHLRLAELAPHLGDRLLELGEARRCPPLGREIRAVDDDVAGIHVASQPRRDRTGAQPRRCDRAGCRAGRQDAPGSPPTAASSRLCRSSSWMACDPVAGLPDGGRLTWRRR